MPINYSSRSLILKTSKLFLIFLKQIKNYHILNKECTELHLNALKFSTIKLILKKKKSNLVNDI